MLGGDSSGLQPDVDCPNALDRNLQLARRLQVGGTPTLFFADGTRFVGAVEASQLRARLAAISAPAGIASARAVDQEKQ